jgi:hypothetical protein
MQMQQIMLYRRVVLLNQATACVVPLARTWGTLIEGRIGRYSLRALEEFQDRNYARRRAREINRKRAAMIVSVEEVLFPQAYLTIGKDMPAWMRTQNDHITNAQKITLDAQIDSVV